MTRVASFAFRAGCLMLCTWAVVAQPVSAGGPGRAAAAPAQAPRASTSAAGKDAVARGEVWFYQRCSLCHMERIVKDETYMTLGPSLKGLLANAPPSKEAQVRETIKSGSLRMPGFKYGLDDKEFEELIAFLKTH